MVLLNDWDLDNDVPPEIRVLVFPGAAVLDEAPAAAIRAFVNAGGGLICTGAVVVADRPGNTRPDPPLCDLSGVSVVGPVDGEETATHFGDEHPSMADERLAALGPGRSVILRAPLLRSVGMGRAAIVRARAESSSVDLPAVLVRRVGCGRVVTLLAGIDHA